MNQTYQINQTYQWSLNEIVQVYKEIKKLRLMLITVLIGTRRHLYSKNWENVTAPTRT